MNRTPRDTTVSYSVSYPLHIRFISVAFPWSTGTSNSPTVNHGKDTDMLRLCHGLYGRTTVAPRLSTDTYGIVTEKLKFSNNLKIVSRKERAYGSTAVYPGLPRITTVMSTANVRNCHGYLRFETVGFRHLEPWKCNKGFTLPKGFCSGSTLKHFQRILWFQGP